MRPFGTCTSDGLADFTLAIIGHKPWASDTIIAVKTLRLLAVCLLMLALPLQGFAAVSPSLCHRTNSDAVALTHAAHMDHASASHHVAHLDAQAQAQAHAHQHGTSPTHEHKVHKCSHCAQCAAACVMAMFTPPQFTFITPDLAWADIAPAYATSIAPRGIERPPRLLLA